MAKTAVATQSVDFEAIDRLEQKLKMLVTVLDRTRAESARATEELARSRADYAKANDENTRLRTELEASLSRLAEAEGAGGELTVLRTEREQIRSRVDDMLRQIEALNL
jgi:lipid II:glycine glycyltransferase (peptidoglycan interpeptide bridge formation enzyme)